MVDSSGRDDRNVEEAVHEVDGPVGAGRGRCELEAVHAEGGIVQPVSVRQVADDSLECGVSAAVVAAPSGLAAVLPSA